MGYLVPIGAIDVLPGDSFRVVSSVLARVAPLQKPVMYPVDIRVHHWFVPNRIIWSDWEEFIVGNEVVYTFPTIISASAAETPLFDYMGVEPVVGIALDVLSIRVYNKIWNEFYRDQDLSAVRTTDQIDLARIVWGKDYFTTARPNPQQGAAVDIGFSAGSAPVWIEGDTGVNLDIDTKRFQDFFNDSEVGMRFSSARFYADLSSATGGIDINELWDAISFQRIAEAREFYGSRYVDYLRWYGVNPRDGRFDRPEYLGGGKQMIFFSEVFATAEGINTEVGDLFGHGIAGLRSRPLRKMFEEHGWMISVMSVRPKVIYQNGVFRRFLRREPTDFWHRELELLLW